MKQNSTQNNIPVVDNCVLAIHQNTVTQKELLVLGGFAAVKSYILGNKNAEVITMQRPLGSFAADCFTPVPTAMADLRVALCDNLGKQKTPQFEASVQFLDELYLSDNFSHKFLAIRLWNVFLQTSALAQQKKRSQAEDDYLDAFLNRIETLTLPFRTNLEAEIFHFQRTNPKAPLSLADSSYYKHPVSLLWANDTAVTEYAVSADSLMPLLFYSLRQIYKSHLYFQRCKVCGRLFLAKTANIDTLCSDACKRERNRINKQTFDEKAKETPYEKAYKDSYDYWYNRMRVLCKEPTLSPETLQQAEQAFADFRKDAKQRKRFVKQGQYTSQEFIAWLDAQKIVIDKYVQKS